MNNIIQLPAPQKDLEYPLMRALEKRRTIRKWKEEPVSLQDLSNLLWAACGITQAATKTIKSKRTSPSATNAQEIKVYTATKEGVFLYDETAHQLIQILAEDIRKEIGTQRMMQSAPLGLIYVSDYSRMKVYLSKDEDRKWFISGTDTGFISENVYLYCAAANLSTAVLGLINREKLHERMGLKECEKVMFTQVVGKSIEA